MNEIGSSTTESYRKDLRFDSKYRQSRAYVEMAMLSNRMLQFGKVQLEISVEVPETPEKPNNPRRRSGLVSCYST